MKEDFFEVRLPPSWRPMPGPDGPQYRDNVLHRKLELAKVEIRPGTGVGVDQTLDTLIDGVRAQAKGLASGLTLGPTRKEGSKEQPIRFFLVTASEQFFVAGLVGRGTKDGAVRAVSVTYADEDPEATPACTEQAGSALLATIRVPDDPVGAPDLRPVRFTPAAAAELRRELRKGDLVWLAVKRDGGVTENVIEVRSDLPQGTPTTLIDEVPVAIDPESEALLSGVTIDHVAGRGFKFDKAEATP